MAYQSELEKLENRYKENPDQWFAALADQYRKAGQMDLALQVVRAGLEKRPNYVSGHIVLARCHLDQKNDAEASNVLKRVLELDGENIMALKTLADIAQRTGDVDGERGWLGRLLEIDPQTDEARAALAKLPAVEAAEPAAAAQAAPAAPPPPAGAVEGFEATSFADVAPPETPAAPAIVEHEPAHEAVAAAPMPALELERTDMSDSAPAQMAPLDLEPSSTDLSVVAPATAGESMPALEREELISLDESSTGAEQPPELLPLMDSALAAGGDAALGLEAPPPALEPMPLMELDTPAPVELSSALPEPAPLVTAAHAQEMAPLTGGPPAAAAPPEEPGTMPAGSEPDPVVTETMAEVYAKQGLLDQARAVYQQLIAQRPTDERLRRRLAELSPRESGARRRRQSAAMTGGMSARAFVAAVLTGRPVTMPVAPPEPEPAYPEPAAPIAQPSEAPRQPAAAGAGGFSFDEFFGGRRT